MIVRSLLRGAGAFALAAAGLGFAAPALASGVASARCHFADPRCGWASSGAVQAFAGYELGRNRPSAVSATTTFKVPKLRCGSTDQAIAPSIGAAVPGGFDIPPVSAATLFVGCHRGKAHYWPELEVYNTIKNYPTKAAHAGDTIVLSIAYGHVSVADRTHNFKVSLANGFTSNDLWIGDEGWFTRTGNPIPSSIRLERVPDFGTLTYSNTRVRRRRLRGLRSDRQTLRGTLQIKTGFPFGSGHAFRTIFKHH